MTATMMARPIPGTAPSAATPTRQRMLSQNSQRWIRQMRLRSSTSTSPMAEGDKRVAMHDVLLAVLGAMNEEHVSIVDLAEQAADDGYGCDRHPSTKTQRKMADTLVAAIRTATGW